MSNRYLVILMLVLLGIGVLWVSRAKHKSSQAEKLRFRNEQSISEALHGFWILRDYRDSIEKGTTPMRLWRTMTRWNYIGYDSNKIVVGGYWMVKMDQMINGNGTWTKEARLVFDLKNSRAIITAFKPMAMDSERTDSNTLIGEFLVDNRDTLLRIYINSDTVDFVKHEQHNCPDLDPYYHLINGKFLAGRYSRIDGPVKGHEIVLSPCGQMTGAEFISDDLEGCTEYYNSALDDSSSFDVVIFEKPNKPDGHTLMGYKWYANGDSLVLTSDINVDAKPLVLIKEASTP